MNDPDCSRLNESERAALRLLSAGHSIKSAAVSLGSTENAVQERLREARRKTGIGSSRELARALAAQENCDRESGLGAAGGPAAAKGGAAISSRTTLAKGLLPMSILLGVFAVTVLQQPLPPIDDPLVAPALGSADDRSLADAYRALRAETRDTEWATVREAALFSRFSDEPGSSRIDNLRVTCGATLCEIAARVDAPVDDYARISTWAQARLESGEVAALGLRLEGFHIVGDPQAADAGTFLAFLRRG